MAGNAQFPPDHKPGMRVPKGGSSCASCEYYKGNLTCGNEYFIKWRGSNHIPAPSPDEYCSDWWEPAQKAKLSTNSVTEIRRKAYAS